MRYLVIFYIAILATMGSVVAHADSSLTATPQRNTAQQNTTQQNKVTISELSWMDKNKSEKEIQTINELAESKLGVKIQRNLSDITTLQRLIDQKLVKADNIEAQQAMGVILGNVMQADFPSTLEWKVYEDAIGRSRALCVKNTQECLFPVTMLSRRMAVGTTPNVQKIYDDSIDMMKAFLPQLPYGGGTMHKLHP